MYLKYALALASVLPLTLAQTYSDCNPLKKTCKPNPGLNSKTFSSDFTKGKSALDGWLTASGNVEFGDDGAEFTVAKKGDAPTIDTDFYFLFGKAEVELKAAPGTGIVSSIVLESDVLDEIDWEALGGDTTQIQTNYFGKGDTSSYDRATYETVATPQETFHTYTIEWSPKSVSWAIDGNTVRTLNYADAKGGSRFPQTPARLRLGIWAGGDSDNEQGTIEWAGGQTDYSGAPFTMYVKSVHIENTHPAGEYTYSDTSGDWQSIKFDDSKPDDDDTSSKTTSSTSSESSTSSGSSETSSSTTDSSESQSESASPTSTGGSGSDSSSDSGSSDSGSDSSSPSESQEASSTDDASAPDFTGAASSLTSSAGGLITVFSMMAAMLQL